MEAIKLDWKSYEDRRISCVSTRANNRKKGGWVLGTSILPRTSLDCLAGSHGYGVRDNVFRRRRHCILHFYSKNW